MGQDRTKSDRLNKKITVGTSAGVLSDSDGNSFFEVYDEKQIRLITQGTGSNVIDIEGILAGMDETDDTNWEQIDQHSGATSAAYDIDTYSYIRFRQTTADTGGTLFCASFFSAAAVAAGNSFSTIQADSGTSPVADSSADTLTISGTANEITTTGDSSTDTLTLALADQIQQPNGSTSAPSYSFANSTNSGLAYTAGETYLATGSQKVIGAIATAVVLYKRTSIRNNGSAANPSIYWSGSGADKCGAYATTYNSVAETANVITADNTDACTFTADGAMIRATTTEITDANLKTNTFAFWEDGSGNLAVKYKNSGGTVTAGSIMLA